LGLGEFAYWFVKRKEKTNYDIMGKKGKREERSEKGK
jgi:hypothetical protein